MGQALRQDKTLDIFSYLHILPRGSPEWETASCDTQGGGSANSWSSGRRREPWPRPEPTGGDPKKWNKTSWVCQGIGCSVYGYEFVCMWGGFGGGLLKDSRLRDAVCKSTHPPHHRQDKTRQRGRCWCPSIPPAKYESWSNTLIYFICGTNVKQLTSVTQVTPLLIIQLAMLNTFNGITQGATSPALLKGCGLLPQECASDLAHKEVTPTHTRTEMACGIEDAWKVQYSLEELKDCIPISQEVRSAEKWGSVRKTLMDGRCLKIAAEKRHINRVR